jgi:DNA-binding MarR family transcriptional regulator
VLRSSPGFLLGKAAQLGADLVERALQPLQLKARHYGVLIALQELGAMSQQELGHVLRIDRTTMVAVIDYLERLGAVRRVVDPVDRRSHLIHLTAQGTAALKRARQLVTAADDELVQGLSAREREQLIDLLQRLVGLDRSAAVQ